MKKSLITIFLAIILGYICASFILEEYRLSNFEDFNNIYYLQIGAYNKLDNALADLTSITNKKVIKEDDKYYSYIGITSSIDNANRIKKLYKEQGINVYIKEKYLNNKDFIYDLEQYDILIKNAKSKEEIDKVLETILSSYEVNVLNK